MVRASKSATPATTPVPKVEASASAPVAKAPRAKKVAAAPAAEPSATQVASATQPAAEVAADASLSGLPVKMTEYSAKLQQLVGLLSTLKNDFKTLEKTVAREMKAAQKASSKKRRNNVNRKPSGFVKPTRISDELAAFLGKTVGTEMARTDVSKELNAYIQTNKLQDAANGRKINPDAKLAKLLKLSKEDELTYFNLQRFMKHHFIKAEVPAVATA
jgi:chromatin remodeling complex protein RSC6